MSAKKRSVLILIVFSVSLLIFGGVGYWYTTARFIESTDNAYVEAKIAVISARVPGYVDEILIKENQQVKTGELLFVIHQAEYNAKVESAEAQVAAANAKINTLQEQLKLQQSLILQAEAEVEIAHAELNRVQKDLQRYTQLDAQSASSRQQLELVQAEELKAVAARQSANAKLNAQKKQLLVWNAQVDELEADRAKASAMLDLAKISLADTRVVAPIDGVIGNKHLELGRYLQSGTPVLNIVSLDDVYVTANFKETQIEHMQTGNAVTIILDAYPDQKLTATIASISPASGSRFSLLPPENATGNFSKIVQRIPIRIEFTDRSQLKGVLRPGFSAIVDVDIREAHNNSIAEAINNVVLEKSH